jgi:hypothetical protein
MSGKARARSSKIWRQKAIEANTLALSTLVTRARAALRLALARQLAARSRTLAAVPARVIFIVS